MTRYELLDDEREVEGRGELPRVDWRVPKLAERVVLPPEPEERAERGAALREPEETDFRL